MRCQYNLILAAVTPNATLEQRSQAIVLLTQLRDKSIYVNYLADAVSFRDAFAFNAVKIRFSAISGVKRSIRNLECNLHRKTRELNFAARNQKW